MAERKPRTVRMDDDLFRRVEKKLEGANKRKADAFDEMMEMWLSDDKPATTDDIAEIKQTQDEILSRLDNVSSPSDDGTTHRLSTNRK